MPVSHDKVHGGQNAAKTWPNKVASVGELRQADNENIQRNESTIKDVVKRDMEVENFKKRGSLKPVKAWGW